MSGCDFRIGQKVVCVDAKPRRGWVPGDDHPVEGQIYTIVAIKQSGIEPLDEPELVLKEISRGFAARHIPPIAYGYGAYRFRPFDEDRYDISIFQDMCVKASRKLVSR